MDVANTITLGEIHEEIKGENIMEEILKELVPKLGVPSIVISIILIIIRMRPITLLTANPIERKMLSKEKQFLINAIKLVVEIILILIYLLFITDSLFTNKKIYSEYFALAWAVVLLIGFFLTMFSLEIKNKNFEELVKDRKKSMKVFLYLISIIFIISYY